MKIDPAWIGRGDYLKHPIPIRTMKEMEQSRFWHGLAVGVGVGVLLWAVIVGVFLLGG